MKPEDHDRLKPVRYRAIVKTNNPEKIMKSLKMAEVETIIPTEDWELLGSSSSFPNGLKLSHETVSLPIYPSLTDKEIEIILSAVGGK